MSGAQAFRSALWSCSFRTRCTRLSTLSPSIHTRALSHCSVLRKKHGKNIKSDGQNLAESSVPMNADAEAAAAKYTNHIATFAAAMAKQKAGLRDPMVLNSLFIDSEGVRLDKLAAVSHRGAQTFVVTVYDPAHVKAITSAILSCGKNFNPQPSPDNPTQLTIHIPKEGAIARGNTVRKFAESTHAIRMQLRNVRGDHIRALRKSTEPHDVNVKLEAAAHKLFSNKEQELLNMMERFRSEY